MEGLRRSIERGVVMTSEHRSENGSWKNYALHVLWALTVAMMGWFMTESTTDRERIRRDTQRIEQRQADDNARIAVNEEQVRNVRESLQRIEAGVEELRRSRERGR
jgi:hypothetical protein